MVNNGRAVLYQYLKCYCYVGVAASSTDIVGSSRFAGGTGTPETGWAQQEQEQSQHHPSHENHGEGQVTSSADWPVGTWH